MTNKIAKALKENFGEELIAVFNLPTFDRMKTQSLVITKPAPLEVILSDVEKESKYQLYQLPMSDNIEHYYVKLSIKDFLNELILGKFFDVFDSISAPNYLDEDTMNPKFKALFMLLFSHARDFRVINKQGFETSVYNMAFKNSTSIRIFEHNETSDAATVANNQELFDNQELEQSYLVAYNKLYYLENMLTENRAENKFLTENDLTNVLKERIKAAAEVIHEKTIFAPLKKREYTEAEKEWLNSVAQLSLRLLLE